MKQVPTRDLVVRRHHGILCASGKRPAFATCLAFAMCINAMSLASKFGKPNRRHTGDAKQLSPHNKSCDLGHGPASHGVESAAGCRLAGCGSSVPEAVLTNADLEKLVETNDEWIASRTGIRYCFMLQQSAARCSCCKGHRHTLCPQQSACTEKQAARQCSMMQI